MSARVLVVDDQSSFRDWAAAWLALQGFDVVGTAEDGRSALAAATKLAPDVVLLDIQLPDVNGIEVARCLARRSAPPVVVLTSARDAADYGRRVVDAPVRGFVTKSDLSPALWQSLVGME